MLPRVSYFPLVYEKLEKLYSRSVSVDAKEELWLAAEDVPLKWCVFLVLSLCVLMVTASLLLAGTILWECCMTCMAEEGDFPGM